MRAITAVAAAFNLVAVSACMTMPPIQTASGQPEITLSNVDVQCVRSGFLNLLVNQRFAVKSATDLQIVAGKVTDNFSAALLLGTQFSGAPEDRITILFVPLADSGLRVIVSEQYVSNAGTGFEKPTPIGQTQIVQNQFETAGQQIQMGCGRV